MNTQESPPPEHRSKSFWKWVYRNLALKASILSVLGGGFLLERQYVRALQEKGREARAHSEVEDFSRALNQYAVEYGYHPEGGPADLLRTLRGENRRRIVFFECAPRSVNSNGEFIDPWGRPYHIDQSNSASPRVYSSGPNGVDERGGKESDDIAGGRKTRW